MTKHDHEKQPFVSALRLFGVFRIWASVIIGILVVVACVAVFVLSYTWETGYVEALGEVAVVECGSVQKLTQCKQSGSTNKCITTESVTCDVKVNYDGERLASFKLDYDEGYEPNVGDRFPLFIDRDDPERVKQHMITEGHRNVARIVCGIVGTIALFVVVVNIVLLNNKSFRLLQGGLGAAGALGMAL